MRLIITVLVCSVLIVGGFFGYKQYQRSEMKQGARDYAVATVTLTAKNSEPEAEAVILKYLDRYLDETFTAHYRSGGLTKPAEISDVAFARDLFDRIYDAVSDDDVSGEVKRLARTIYAQTRPLEGPGVSSPPSDDQP